MRRDAHPKNPTHPLARLTPPTPPTSPFAWLARTTVPSAARGMLLAVLENLPERYQGQVALLGPPAPGAYRGLLRDLPGGVLILTQSLRTLEYFIHQATKAGRKVWTQHGPDLKGESRLAPLPGVAILRGPELDLPGAKADEKALCAQLAEQGLAALVVPCSSTRPPPKRSPNPPALTSSSRSLLTL